MHWKDIPAASSSSRRIAVIGEERDADLTADAMIGALDAMSLETEVVRVDCTVDDFVECVSHLTACGFEGASIGNPFKPEAAKLAKQFFIVKHGLGVANALKLGKSIYAQNTEVAAFTSKVRDIKPGLALV